MDIILVMNSQNSFLSPEGSVYMGEKAEILKIRMKDYLSDFNGMRLFFREKHSREDSFFSNDKTHSLVTTPDFNIVEELKPLADNFFDKTRYSAFFDTNLGDFLKSKKVEKVTMAGLETHTSILFTAEELRNRGYDVTIIEPCCMSRDDFMHSYSIALMRNFLSVRVGE